MDNQFDNMDLPDDDLIDFDGEGDQQFLDPGNDSPEKEPGNSKKTALLIGGIIGSVAMLVGGVYLLNQASPDTIEPSDTVILDVPAVSPDEKVDVEEFDMNKHTYISKPVETDVTELEKEDTIVYWENPNNTEEFIGISDDGQLFGRISEEEAALLDDEEYQAELRAEQEQEIQEFWKENPDETPDGEWLEDGTFKVATTTATIDVYETVKVAYL